MNGRLSKKKKLLKLLIDRRERDPSYIRKKFLKFLNLSFFRLFGYIFGANPNTFFLQATGALNVLCAPAKDVIDMMKTELETRTKADVLCSYDKERKCNIFSSPINLFYCIETCKNCLISQLIVTIKESTEKIVKNSRLIIQP